MKGIFVTGTDTGVGKTFVSCIIAEGLRGEGIDVGVIKPVETGCRRRKDSLVPSDGSMLKRASGSRDHLDLIVPYRFRAPLAPFMAAELEKRRISVSKIKRSCIKIAEKHDFIIIEGAGGLLVPVTKSYTFLNLIKDLEIPVIIVALNKLGVINHLSLTLNCLEQNRIAPICIILNNTEPGRDIAQRTNLLALQKILKNTPLIEVPYNGKKIFQKKIITFLKDRNLI